MNSHLLNGKIAVVAGATGLVGSQLVDRLLASPFVSQVKVLVRRPGAFPPHEKLTEILLPSEGTGYSALTDLTAEKFRGDSFFCCLGTTLRKAGSKEAFRAVDYDAIFCSAQIAEAQKARSFVLVSSVGAHSKSLFFYPRVKGEVEEAIAALKIPRVVFFRPSFLVAETSRNERRPGEELGIALYRLTSSWLPRTLRERFGSEVKVLVEAMHDDGVMREEAGRYVVEAHEIYGGRLTHSI